MSIEIISKLVDYGVIGILGFMGFLALFFWVERVLFFRKVDLQRYSAIEELEVELTNNISIISSIASNAPYIGLLGTVLSIIVTFYQISVSGSFEVAIIMKSLSLALKSTAFGLVVAIPAIFFYNHLDRKIEVLLNRWILVNKES